MPEQILILSTAVSREEALRIARTLVDRRLAACVNIVPAIESVYRWKDRVEEAGEVLLLIKTLVSQFEAIEETIRSLHSYELPECISVSIDDGEPAYLKWIHDSVSKPGGEPETTPS
jgi:periplasmic divalent cation tolerance protein